MPSTIQDAKAQVTAAQIVLRDATISHLTERNSRRRDTSGPCPYHYKHRSWTCWTQGALSALLGASLAALASIVVAAHSDSDHQPSPRAQVNQSYSKP